MGALDAISAQAREVLLEALMCVAWADRTLAPEERQAARAAALGLGLVLPGDRDLTAPERKPIPPERLDVSGLLERDKEMIYLCSAWMAFADEIEDPSETQILERLRQALGLSGERTAWLGQRAADLRERQKPDLSWWRAFDTLVVEAAKALGQEGDGG